MRPAPCSACRLIENKQTALFSPLSPGRDAAGMANESAAVPGRDIPGIAELLERGPGPKLEEKNWSKEPLAWGTWGGPVLLTVYSQSLN